jgi:hypothetical protein
MQARATATSTASRSHSTSDHLLSVVSAAKKLALFARFEKPARFLVPAEVPTWGNRVFSTDANDLWVVDILMYELCRKCLSVATVGKGNAVADSRFLRGDVSC